MPVAVARRRPPRRGAGLDRQLNKLFATSEGVKLAQIKGDAREAQRLLADGLAQSCLLLNEIQEIDTIEDVDPTEATIRLLKRRDHLESFLEIETRLLGFTKLDHNVVEYLLKALRALLTSSGELPSGWRDNLDLFARMVCNEAKAAGARHRPPVLIRRVIVAGGGALIAMLNLAPIAAIPLPPPVITMSATAGVWLIAEAAKDHLKAFFER